MRDFGAVAVDQRLGLSERQLGRLAVEVGIGEFDAGVAAQTFELATSIVERVLSLTALGTGAVLRLGQPAVTIFLLTDGGDCGAQSVAQRRDLSGSGARQRGSCGWCRGAAIGCCRPPPMLAGNFGRLHRRHDRLRSAADLYVPGFGEALQKRRAVIGAVLRRAAVIAIQARARSVAPVRVAAAEAAGIAVAVAVHAVLFFFNDTAATE